MTHPPSRLQVDYIDCIQVHDPEFAPDYKVRACAHVHHRFVSSEAPLKKSFRSRSRKSWSPQKRLQQRIHLRSARFVGCERASFANLRCVLPPARCALFLGDDWGRLFALPLFGGCCRVNRMPGFVVRRRRVQVIVEQTLPALIKLKEAGKVKMVGMTGYPL